MRRLLWPLSAALVFLLTHFCASAAEPVGSPIVIKFSHVAAVDTPKGQGAARFKQLAEERTQGRVRVDVHPNSSLFKDKEELEALQIGSVQMLAPSISKFGPLGFKEFEIFDLPFIMPDTAAYLRITRSPYGQSLLKKLETRGIRGLAYWDAGFRVITSNRPLRTPADLKGMKIRINSSKITDDQMRALGVQPQNMAFSEVYQALQTGVVDGSETVMSNVYTQKFHEVQKYVLALHHTHQAYAVVVNKKFWDALPDDIRKILDGAVNDATLYADKLAATEDLDAAAKIAASGKTTVITPTPAEHEEFRKALFSVHRDMESRLGRENIQAFYQAAGFVPPR